MARNFASNRSSFFKESGLTLVEAAERLSLPKGTLKNWVYADRQGELITVGKKQNSLTELELELSRIKRELAEVKMERDFIKKCAAYLAKVSR
ncbi:transposase [Nitrosomonas communis]|uniref:transposase n=1 Tax=Nitrosomonas communis TaxID=44574 RepID=UPI003D26A468